MMTYKEKFLTKKLLIILLIIVIIVYAIKSIFYILEWNQNNKEKIKQYSTLLQKQESIDKEINILKIKVSGLREQTLNPEILESQAKEFINVSKNTEIILSK